MRRLLVVILAGFLVIGLVIGCATKDKKDSAMKSAKLVKFKTSAKLKRVWSKSAGTGQDKRYSRFVPAVTSERIYVSDVEGKVFAFNAKTGKSIWKVKLDTDVSAGVSVEGDQVYLGTYNGNVIALNAHDGSRLWEAKASSEVMAVPVSNGSVVVAQSIDGQVFGFDAQSGEKKWSFDHVVPVLTLRGAATPIFVSDLVILPFENGQLVALKALEGSSVWEARVGQPKGATELERIIDVDSSPLVVGDTLYAATFQGSIAAFSASEGRPLWKNPVSSYQDLAYSQSKLFVSEEDSAVVAFNSISGDKVWENELLHRRDINAPAIIGDYVAVIDKKGYLHLLKQDDGEFAYRFKPLGNRFRSPMVSMNAMLYVLADNGRLSAYKLKPRK